MRSITSLNTRLVVSHLAVSMISIALMAAFSGSAIFNASIKDVEHGLEDLAFATSNVLEGSMEQLQTGGTNIDALKMQLNYLFAKHPEISYAIYLPDGTPIASKAEALPAKADPNLTPEVWLALNNDMGEGDNIRLNEQGQQAFFVAVRIQREDQVLAVLSLSAPLLPALDSARRSLGLLLAVSLGVTIGVGLFGWLLARNIALPIQNLTYTSERLARGDLSARVIPSGPQELERLSESFNLMAGRLQDHVDELRAFVANASHELRTPLTVVKLRVEALRSGALEERNIAEQFLEEIESEIDRLSRMVNDLLDLSRMEAGLVSQKRTLLNLGTIANDVYETFTIRASKAGVELTLDLEPDLPMLLGNEDQLRRVLYNFVENAIKYTPRGGKVDMYVRSGHKNTTLRLLVKDTGPGIAAEDLPHIFERFYRVEATRPRYGTSKGSGLGLAIAKSIVENHGGKIGASSQLGKGATFWVELPTNT